MENRLPRLTVKEIWNETLKFFNLEKGILFTFISLLKKPYFTVQTYLNVNRRKYSNPLQYILFGVAIYVVIIKLSPGFNYFIEQANTINQQKLQALGDKGAVYFESNAKAQELLMSYQNVLYLFILPVISIITNWFGGKNYNYAENLAINAFTFGTAVWVSLLFGLVTFFLNYTYTILGLLALLSWFVTCYMYKNIFQFKWVKAILVSILVVSIQLISSVIVQLGFTFYFMSKSL